MLPQSRQFWNALKAELANKGLYKASIGSMRLRLQKLQETEPQAQKLRSKDGYQEVDGVLYH